MGILIIFLFIIVLFIFLLDYKIKLDSSSIEKTKKQTIETIKKNGTLIEVETNRCEVIKNDTLKKPSYYESSELYGLKFIKTAKYKVREKTIVQSILICNYRDSKNVERKITKQINMDNTLLKFKIFSQDKISIYIDELNDNYYIDLDFLKGH